MINDPRLERYLTTLEQALKPFPVSDRAEVITEIKSHVLSALERDPQARLDSVLSALGEPETVANRYLLERGLKPTKTSIHPVVKWLTIGFLGTVAMLLLFAGFLLNHFSSLIKIDGDKGRVEMFGGLIDIDGGKGHFSISDVSEGRSAFVGKKEFLPGQKLTVKFSKAKLEMSSASGPEFSWACKATGALPQEVNMAADSAIFDLSALDDTKCKLAIPPGTRLQVQGSDGKINFDSPSFDVDAKIENGKVSIHPSEKMAYRYELTVDSGKIDKFESSNAADARVIQVHLTNGLIQNEN